MNMNDMSGITFGNDDVVLTTGQFNWGSFDNWTIKDESSEETYPTYFSIYNDEEEDTSRLLLDNKASLLLDIINNYLQHLLNEDLISFNYITAIKDLVQVFDTFKMLSTEDVKKQQQIVDQLNNVFIKYIQDLSKADSPSSDIIKAITQIAEILTILEKC